MLIETKLDLEDVTREELQEFLDRTPADTTLEANLIVEDWQNHWEIDSIGLRALWGTGVFLSASTDLDGITREGLQNLLDLSDGEADFVVELEVIDRSIGRALTVDPTETTLVALWERESAADD